ncbi:MAG: hypothetical protein ABL995_09235 [Bryobacteraceae bacterium]
MADFRKLVYAVASVGLFAGLSVSANAQGLFCDSLTAAPQIVRSEGYTELVGDIQLRCRAVSEGIATPAGQNVPQANVHVAILGTTVTSRTIASGFNEALLMIDEPGKLSNPTQLYCGKSGVATDNGPSGAGVCAITSTGNPAQTYDGTAGSGSYGSGRPNIYQGRPDGPNGVVFPFVPFDPPGSNSVRTIRITNIRIDATKFDPAAFPQISAVVTVEGQASVALQFNNTVVATVLKGMGATTVTADKGFLQCISETGGHTQVEALGVVEGFRSAWKPKNSAQYVANYTGTQNLPSWIASITQFQYNGTTSYGSGDLDQNIPDYRYFSESGFESLAFGSEHGINKAGVADYGTRISFAISAPPSGTTLTIPTTAYLTNGVGTSGVTKMTSYTSGTTGLGVYTPVSGSAFTIPAAGATVVYEVLFSDPGSIETLNIAGTLSYSAPTTDAAVGVTTTVSAATFAPYYTSVGTDSNGIPRFKQTTGPAQDFVAIGKCSCSLLFPWVVSDSNYVTGFAVSNTSMDPTNASSLNVPGYSANQQSGTVTVYYFGRTGSSPVSSGTAAQSASSPSANVPAGSFATFLAPSGFAGYAIANSQFQYCHGVAFLFSSNSGVPPMSYLGLVMDGVVGNHGYNSDSSNNYYSGSGDAKQLQRTIQVFKDSLGQ